MIFKAKNYLLLVVFFLLFFFSLIHVCNLHNYFIASLLSLLILLSYYLLIGEFYFNNHLSNIEVAFIVFLNIFCLLFTIILKNIIWVIFLLEIQTFLVFGISALFKGVRYLKGIESSLTYLNPAFLSFILILSSLFLSSISKNFDILCNILIVLALIIKMGAIPYNFWVTQVLKNLTYNSIVLVTLLNKLSIIVILFNYISSLWFILFLVGLLSLILGCLLILNTYNTKEFIAFSSIINSGWIITICSVNIKNVGYVSNEDIIGFFLISYYLGVLIFLRYLGKSFNLLEICSSINFFVGLNLRCFLISLSLLSLAGIPPLGGFITKYVFIIQFTETYGIIFTLLIIFSSILSIFAYIRPLITFNYRFVSFIFFPIDINRQLFYVNNLVGFVSFIVLLVTASFLLIGI